MKNIKIQTFNSTAHLLLNSELDKVNIRFIERSFTDSSFPSLDNLNIYGEIIIEIEYQDKVDALLRRINSTNDYKVFLQDIPQKAKLSFVQLGLIAYSIVVTILFLKYWHLEAKASTEKNFDVSWTFDNTSIIYKDKKSNKISFIYTDANFDGNFEKIEIYANGLGATSISKDRNEDGHFEEMIYYSLNNEYSGRSLDIDNNQMHEYYEMILENKDTLIFVDENQNGIMELKK
jgi:hypothetical protein